MLQCGKQRQICFYIVDRNYLYTISEELVLRSETMQKNPSVSVFVYDVKTEKNSVLPNIYDVSIVYD